MAKAIFLGLRKMLGFFWVVKKHRGIFLGCKKGTKGFFGYAKESSGFFGYKTNSEVVSFLGIKYEPLSGPPLPSPRH